MTSRSTTVHTAEIRLAMDRYTVERDDIRCLIIVKDTDLKRKKELPFHDVAIQGVQSVFNSVLWEVLPIEEEKRGAGLRLQGRVGTISR